VGKVSAGFIGAVAALAITAAVLAIVGKFPGESQDKPAQKLPLAEPDVPPLEFAYIDSERVAAYLGQAEGGLATSEQRGEQIKRAINASLAAGASVNFGKSQQDEESTTATVKPNAADHFYAFLRLLRHAPEAKQGACNDAGSRRRWLGRLDFTEPPKQVMKEIECIGVGNFVRIEDVQLFLPPFAQALPRVQSANAFYGALPAPRTPFTSPAQSVALTRALHAYAKQVGAKPRMPFVGAPYGEGNKVGKRVAMFMPAKYSGLTPEPSLLTGSVTVVGKIVYAKSDTPRPSSRRRRRRVTSPAYIDYPTISTFGRALVNASTAFRTDLGVCSKAPTRQTRAQAPAKTLPAAPARSTAGAGTAARRQTVAQNRSEQQRVRRAKRKCTSDQKMLDEVKKAVSFRPPFVIVLPLAIYQ